LPVVKGSSGLAFLVGFGYQIANIIIPEQGTVGILRIQNVVFRDLPTPPVINECLFKGGIHNPGELARTAAGTT
jgi:hypothetical protein